jgi:hypothetical protein
MTWGKTNVAGLSTIPAGEANPATAAEPVLLDRLAGNDLARLTIGFYCWFWGALLVVVALCESLTLFSLRMLHAVVFAAGCLALVVGAQRLHQVRSLGDAWRRRTREALIAAGLLAYLCPFFLMWRRLPLNLYLLGHALAFFAVFCYSLTVGCQTVAGIGRASGKRGLVTQAILFGTLSIVLLFPPFALFAQVMVLAAREGRDPLNLLQFWLGRVQPWLVLTPLVPFALTLSLIWAAKDLVLQRLLEAREDKPGL